MSMVQQNRIRDCNVKYYSNNYYKIKLLPKPRLKKKIEWNPTNRHIKYRENKGEIRFINIDTLL